MKQKTKEKGITLIALVITVIVMLILVAVSVNIAMNGGIFTKARKAAFQADVAKYKEELQAFLVANYKDEDVSKEIQEGKYYNYNNKDAEEGRDLTECIPSYNENKYKKSFVVEENKLKYVYEGNNKEAEWVKEYGLEIQYTYPKVTINIDGEGTVKVTGEIKDSPESKETKTETEFTAIAYKKYELTATGGTKNINGNDVEFVFSRWLKDGEVISTNATETITVTGDATYTAIFIPESTIITYLNGDTEQYCIDSTNNLATYMTQKSTIGVSNIISVEFGNNCTELPGNAFYECTRITKINLNNVTVLGKGAFGRCSSLEVVNGEKINKVNSNAFEICSKLKEINLGSKGNAVESFSFRETFNFVDTHNIIMKIYINSENTTLIESINKNFAGTIEYYDESTGELLNIILGLKYQGNTEITWEEIPNKEYITEIREKAFSGCTGITGEITIPDQITVLNRETFKETGITKINLNNVTVLENAALARCPSLEVVNGEKINKVNSNAFEICSKLKEINLGSKGNAVESFSFKETFNFVDTHNIIMKIYINSENTTLIESINKNFAGTIEYYDALTGNKITNPE